MWSRKLSIFYYSRKIQTSLDTVCFLFFGTSLYSSYFQTVFSQSIPRIRNELTLNFELPLGILIEQQALTYALNVATAPQLSNNCHGAPVSLEDIIHCIKYF